MRNRRKGYLHTSREIAKARAELTVASDRLGCHQEELGQLRREILDTLSKYLNPDLDIFEIRMDFVYERKQGVQDVKTIQIK